MNRERLILGVSLLLNVVLFFLLIQSNRTAAEQPTGQEIAEATTAAEVSSPEPVPTETEPPAPTDVPSPLEEATTTPQPEPTATAVPTTPPEPTATPMPSPTLIPTPVPSPTNVPGPDWLRYTNLFRTQAGVPQLRENVAWSEGSRLHSVYMINTNQTVHKENINSPWYTAEGNDAGINGNIAASGWLEAPDSWPIDYWISAPFHVVPMLDPTLREIGFGLHRDAASNLLLAATMDVKRGSGDLPDSINYPLFFPKDGGQTWVLKYDLPEFPNPMTSCSGFAKPVGAPIVIQLGSGELTPNIDSTSLLEGDSPLAHCVIDETRYVNPNPEWQRIGRLILDERDAIIILPGQPLVVGQRYTVNITVNGAAYSWQFDAVSRPQ